MAQKKSNKWIWGVSIFAIIIFIFAFNYGFKTRTYYIANQTPTDFEEVSDVLTDEERAYYENRVLFEANFYSNENENGVQLQELRLNYFTDPSLSTIATRGTGMQYKGDYKLKDNQVSSKEEASEFRPDDLYYYDTTATNGDVISWDGGKVATNLNRKTSLIVKIDDKPYLLKLTAKKEKKWLDFILLETYYYAYDDVFVDIMQAIKTNSKKAGDFYITLDLSFYFTVFDYDELSGKWNDKNIAKEVLTYSVLKFHYDENGAQTAADSIFGVIENDSEFDARKKYTYKFVGPTSTESITFINGISQNIGDFSFINENFTFDRYSFKENDVSGHLSSFIINKDVTITYLYTKDDYEYLEIDWDGYKYTDSFSKSEIKNNRISDKSFYPVWETVIDYDGTYVYHSILSNVNDTPYQETDYVVIEDSRIVELCQNGVVYTYTYASSVSPEYTTVDDNYVTFYFKPNEDGYYELYIKGFFFDDPDCKIRYLMQKS